MSNAMNISPRDELIMQWEQAQKAAAAAKDLEMKLRKQVVEVCFPDAPVGTSNLELTRGYKLKAVKKLNYSLDKTDDSARTDAALDAIAKIGNEGTFIAERLVKWKPELSITEYKAIQTRAAGGDENAKKMLEHINAVLTITDASPELEMVFPKA